MEGVPMTVGSILDPRALAPGVSARDSDLSAPLGPNGFNIASLKGKRVGIRHDVYWQSWDYVAADWATLLEARGADVSFWQARSRMGKEAEGITEELNEFVNSIDIAIVGLATCGSCTMWTIHDAVLAANAGKPTIVVATEYFVELSHELAATDGRPDLVVKVMPYPLEGRTEPELHRIATDEFPDLLGILGVN
jgi:hypothetical protein